MKIQNHNFLIRFLKNRIVKNLKRLITFFFKPASITLSLNSLKIFNSNGFQLQPLNTEASSSDEISLNIFFINISKKIKVKFYNHILIVNQNNMLDTNIFKNIKNEKITFCSSIGEFCKIKYDINFTEIKYDCIFLFCMENAEQEFLKQIIHSNEFYNADLILPSDKTGLYRLDRKKFGYPITGYIFPHAGTHRFLPQLVHVLSKLNWLAVRSGELLRNLRYSKKYFSKTDAKPNIRFLSNLTGEIHNTLDYFCYSFSHYWSSLDDIRKDTDMNYVILMRDPRDIISSYYHFCNSYDQKVYKDLIWKKSITLEDKLFITLKGHLRYFPFENPTYLLEWPSIDEIMDLYLLALNLDHVYIIRFEDLHADNNKAIKKLLNNIGLYPSIFYDFNEDFFAQMEYLSSFEYQTQGKLKRGNENNETYRNCRKGVVGDWRNLFTPKIVDYIKETTGDKLIKLGYENNMDWHL